jgi:hypothetical protein
VPPLLEPLAAIVQHWLAAYPMLGFVVLMLPVLIVVRARDSAGSKPATASRLNADARAVYQQPVALPHVGNRFMGGQFSQWLEPITIAGIRLETKDKHIAIGGTTGSRKTTLIAHLIMQARRPCVVIAGDSSPYALEAMRARGWRVWSADGKNGGLYCFEGSPREAAQIITALFKMTTSDTGLQRGMAAGVFRNAIADMDERGEARSWPALRRALLEADPPDGLTNRNFEAARVAWLARIDSLMDTLGPALGHDTSVLDCVRSECGLFFDLNAFSDMDMASRFGELAVRLTQHAADKTGDFWWIIDELGLFDADLLGQIVRTCRIRRVKFVGASQIISDFGKVLRGLVKVWFVGEQTAADRESRHWCSELTMGYVPPENFAEHATPPGSYYVVADGRVQHLQIRPWHHPSPVAPLRVYSTIVQPSVSDPVSTSFEMVGATDTAVQSADGEVSEAEELLDFVRHQPVRHGPHAVPEWVSGIRLKAGYRDRAQLAEIWRRHVFPYGVDGCYETTYSVNGDGSNGRPRCGYMGQPWLVYALVLAVHDGLDLDVVKEEMKARMRSADHRCENNKCVRVEHLQWKESIGANARTYHDRRRDTLRLLTVAKLSVTNHHMV